MQDSKLLLAGTISGTTNAITGQSIVGAAGAAILSSYSIDTTPQGGLVNNLGSDWGEGTPLYLKWVVQTAIAGASGGVKVDVVSDSAAGLTTAPTVLASATIPAGSYAAGSWGYVAIPPVIGGVGQEFLGCQFTPLATNSTAGVVVAEITNQIDDPKSFYRSGFSVV